MSESAKEKPENFVRKFSGNVFSAYYSSLGKVVETGVNCLRNVCCLSALDYVLAQGENDVDCEKNVADEVER